MVEKSGIGRKREQLPCPLGKSLNRKPARALFLRAPHYDYVLSSADAACSVTAPIRHDADRSTAAARANEAAALGDRRERRSIFYAGGRKGERGRVKAIGVRARHAEGA